MPFLTGLGIGLSLIIAIGAQNAFVLRQGIRRQHVFVVALICAASDAVLICAGVVGVGAALETVPWLVTAVRWVGVAFLLTYAFLALRRASKPSGDALEAAADAPPHDGQAGGGTALATRTATSSLLAVVGATLAITWLNPHVYLDTVIFLGSVAQAQSGARWIFAAGCITGSFLWFFALAYGARLLGRWLSSPRAWRILDVIVAVFMLVIAGILAFGH
ncbi:LysE/ArgO family amino acid transporter [Microbacterium sp. ZW T5_56]|uniref:LysE/ArgO family amino acid transporter n=1 Tax=Microbacterium sp. ZW T5_56 TaxID=3378081 RepID=UPI0038529B0C